MFDVSGILYIIFDFVIHFACLKSVEESINKPLIYWENNVLGTLNLLKVILIPVNIQE